MNTVHIKLFQNVFGLVGLGPNGDRATHMRHVLIQPTSISLYLFTWLSTRLYSDWPRVWLELLVDLLMPDSY